MNFQNPEHKVIYEKMQAWTGKGAISEVSPASYNTEEYLKEIVRQIEVMQYTRQNFAYRHLQSHRRFLGKPVTFIKKVIRKILKWYIEPIAFQQTEFNNSVTPAMGRITEILNHFNTKFNELEKQNEILVKMKNELDNARQDLQDINKQNMILIDERKKLTTMLDLKENNLVEQMNQYDIIQREFNIQKIEHEKLSQQMELIEKIGVLDQPASSIFIKETFAQSGEDSIVTYILHVLDIPLEQTTYVDLGANHAKELSNTYYLYKKGAKGILVEANKELIPELKFYRSKDIVLNQCIGQESDRDQTFYILNGDGLSTTDYEAALNFCAINPDLKIIDQISLKTITYNDVVDRYLGEPPTLLSIDIEGKDIEIIESMDMEDKRPLIIIIEMIKYDTKLAYNTKNNEIIELMKKLEYDEYSFTGINSIFIDRRYLIGRNMVAHEYSN